MEEPLIPERISRRAFYTIPMFIVSYVVARWKQYRYSEMLLLLTTTSYLFHARVHRWSLIKLLDMSTAISTLSIITLVNTRRFTRWYRFLWYASLMVSLVGYLHNQMTFYNKRRQFHLLSDEQKESEYVRATYTHMALFHVFQPLVATICMLNGK